MFAGTELLEALPVAVYMTDPEGRITFYNEAAAALWGYRPALGSDLWCGSWRLYWPDGMRMPHEECPMAIALREGRELRGMEAIAERPDGTRVPFLPYPTLLRDSAGRVVGAINLLVDISERKHAEMESARLIAIVEGSDDAIISKTLDSRVRTWNDGATRIFGYTAEEMIGQPITRIIPPELHGEEADILEALKRRERIRHFETVRMTKDGRRIDMSLTVSPMLDRAGNVVGASKIGRDVTERKRNEQLKRLLLDELNHRVKNTLATVQAIAGQSLSLASNPKEFVSSFNGRIQALARAHDLLVEGDMKGATVDQIVRDQVVLGSDLGSRVDYAGPGLMLNARVAVQLALVLHELATNARKYGALSCPSGRLSITWTVLMQSGREFLLEWRETGVSQVRTPSSRGFGTTLIERTIEASGGEAVVQYGADGMTCRIRLPIPDQDRNGAKIESAMPPSDARSGPVAEPRPLDLRGKRILVIEDEPLIAMEIESYLTGAGCHVIGPAGTIKRATQLIADTACDAALIDANLRGHPVDELAAALTRRNIPFVFATGYGRDALPGAFRDAPMLAKPFTERQALAALRELIGGNRRAGDVVPFRPRHS
ncbi:MAG TPA: PAS domain S-box protein [Alphaproteobacteria bacterium]